MAKTKNKQDIQDYQNEIDQLKKEVDSLRSKSQIASLKTEVDDLNKQEVNAQISTQQSMTNIVGYDEEFTRLKEDAVKQLKKDKKDKLIMHVTSLFTIPLVGVIIYLIFKQAGLILLFEFDQATITIVNWVLAGFFVLLEIQAFFSVIKTLLINPEVIPDQTLSYLSLTAKEHVLDPKGSVIREKYGTAKWSAVTRT